MAGHAIILLFVPESVCEGFLLKISFRHSFPYHHRHLIIVLSSSYHHHHHHRHHHHHHHHHHLHHLHHFIIIIPSCHHYFYHLYHPLLRRPLAARTALEHEIDPVLEFEKKVGFATDCCAPATVCSLTLSMAR